MSLEYVPVLMESEVPSWVAGLVMLVMMLAALAFVLQVGNSRPHS